MTQARKLKKDIRARAKKTGESYAAARRQILALRSKRSRQSGAPTPIRSVPPSPGSSAGRGALGGVSDLNCRERTGHGLDHWFAVLDAFGAAQKGHTDAARHLRQDHGVPAWHSQGITVAYERAKGLRDINQSSSGRFQVSVSRVVPAGVPQVIRALASAEGRRRWLAEADPGLTRALRAALQGPKRSELAVRPKGDARLRLRWGASSVEIRIDPRPGGKSSIVADNSNLPEPRLIEVRREAWKTALDALRRHLAG